MSYKNEYRGLTLELTEKLFRNFGCWPNATRRVSVLIMSRCGVLWRDAEENYDRISVPSGI